MTVKYKAEVYEKIMAGRIVAILRKIDVGKVKEIARALLEGGIYAMEVTMDTPGALEAIQTIKSDLADRAAVGAGTVLDPETGRLALLSGAEFLVAPNLNVDVIRLGNRYGRLVIPGCATPSEIETAYEAGADIVKLFPAVDLGAGYIKNVKGPLGHITVMATGGVGIENADAFFAAGADILGVGGSLINKEAIARGDFQAITDYATELVAKGK
jgi:2-dehydro-3-deoxyphosphogluconate aldolase/(4S)-4-hydroxy-2-oxoglutarate aldolase